MNIEDLEKNGIFFFEDIAEDLPQHINKVRASLLDFSGTVVDAILLSRNADLTKPHTAGENETHDLDDKLLESLDLHAADRALIKHYQEIRDEARTLREGEDREAEWQTFFLVNFLRPLVSEARMKDEDTRSIARAKLYYEYFESAQCRPWTLFHKPRKLGNKGFRQESRVDLMEPKPDWVAFFPVYNSPTESIPTSKRWQLMKDAQVDTIENFSYSTLLHLDRHGVESNARKSENPVPSDYMCFPWLIVEHQKAGDMAESEEKCYGQAANAGAAAVMMLETLSKIVPEDIRQRNKESEHIPPVVTMTTVDETVRVWITYSYRSSDNDPPRYWMECIWKGDMTRILDLFEFRAILENTHTWATREQRPRISSYIDLWKDKHPVEHTLESPSSLSTALIMGTQTTKTNELLPVEEGPVGLSQPSGLERQAADSGSSHEQAKRVPETKTEADNLRVSNSKDIFKKRILLPYRGYPGKKIPVKLPDVRGRDSNALASSDTSPPQKGASNVLSTIPATSGPEKKETAPQCMPFGQRSLPTQPSEESENTWPTGIRFEFKPLSPSQKSSPSLPRKLNAFDFQNGTFNYFIPPGVSGFASAMPSTPPPPNEETKPRTQ